MHHKMHSTAYACKAQYTHQPIRIGGLIALLTCVRIIASLIGRCG